MALMRSVVPVVYVPGQPGVGARNLDVYVDPRVMGRTNQDGYTLDRLTGLAPSREDPALGGQAPGQSPSGLQATLRLLTGQLEPTDLFT